MKRTDKKFLKIFSNMGKLEWKLYAEDKLISKNIMLQIAEPLREKEPDDQYNYMMKTIKFLETKPDEQQLIEYLRANGVEI